MFTQATGFSTVKENKELFVNLFPCFVYDLFTVLTWFSLRGLRTAFLLCCTVLCGPLVMVFTLNKLNNLDVIFCPVCDPLIRKLCLNMCGGL